MSLGCGHIVQMLENYGNCGKLGRSGMSDAYSEPSQTSKIFFCRK